MTNPVLASFFLTTRTGEQAKVTKKLYKNPQKTAPITSQCQFPNMAEVSTVRTLNAYRPLFLQPLAFLSGFVF